MDKSVLPSVSIIIVNLNGLKHLSNCLLSLDQLNYPKDKVEIIMVDNASTDGSVDFVKENFPHVNVLTNPVNCGFAQPNNKAAKVAKGDYLALINNDMRADANWLTELIKPILDRPSLACVGSKILTWDGSRIDFVGGSLSFYGLGFQEHFQEEFTDKYDQPRPLLFACGGAMLINKNIFLEVGGFDEDYFAYLEDVDLGWRLWVMGYEVQFAPKAVVFHRFHGTSARFKKHKISYISERNALFSVFKNYDEINFNKILLASLLLSNKRCLLDSEIDNSSYVLSTFSSDSSMNSAAKEISATIDVSPRGNESILMRKFNTLFRLLRGADLKLIISLIKANLTFYVPRFIVRLFSSELEVIKKSSVANLLANNDIMDNLESLLIKRQFIQSRRKREDKEILTFFTPFHTWLGDTYLWQSQELAQSLGIDKLFE